ncbi:hypothetical protein BaRGS_00037442 [Batillaria attramentaria]|uniref:Guanine nucleotide-binding protein-like 1 n=1 Tax=Batillaria attramentaria TaxID=370345 RepID=A0ABD0J9X9_9CAEN
MPRKQPYSGKQKKKQLRERRSRKQDPRGAYDDDAIHDVPYDGDASADGIQSHLEVQHINQQPSAGKDCDPNRFRLHFLKITPEEMRQRKKAARKPLTKVKEDDLEISMESVHGSDESLDFPKRPPWNFSLTKTQLEQQEQDYFHEYLQTMLTSHKLQDLSFFELNLETWRQLWRVTEISDILLLIADIRYPALHLPPSLYRYLRKDLRRDVLVVLNKVDLAPPSLVSAWRAYLTSVFPEAHIVCFSSFPKPPEESPTGLHKKQRRTAMKPMGPQDLLDVCREVIKDKVDLTSWQHKLDTENTSTAAPDKHTDTGDAPDAATTHHDHTAQGFDPGIYQRFRDGILTIGCIGYPNVGKSSLINGLVGRKVVSVSRTPGHTKHLQTIFLTPTVRLSDCPGLVFPSYVDKSLQVREPYSAVGYLAQRVDLPSLLRLSHPAGAEQSAKRDRGQEIQWSALDICEGWAIKHGFFTAKASRPDIYRAANQILRMAVEGRVRLCLAPPKYFQQQEKWRNDPFATQLTELLHRQTQLSEHEEESSDSESEGEHGTDSEDGDAESDGETEAKCYATSNPFALLTDD